MTPKAKEQLKALEQAIVKWKGIVHFDKRCFGPDDCKCCKIWNHKPNYCKGCPIYEFSGDIFCNNTPYSEHFGTELSVDANRMLSFLYEVRYWLITEGR